MHFLILDKRGPPVARKAAEAPEKFDEKSGATAPRSGTVLRAIITKTLSGDQQDAQVKADAIAAGPPTSISVRSASTS